MNAKQSKADNPRTKPCSPQHHHHLLPMTAGEGYICNLRPSIRPSVRPPIEASSLIPCVPSVPPANPNTNVKTPFVRRPRRHGSRPADGSVLRRRRLQDAACLPGCLRAVLTSSQRCEVVMSSSSAVVRVHLARCSAAVCLFGVSEERAVRVA
ncbi:hypothetical protein BC567DRAFT_239148 [Phyllosticta citribraziliensis]